MPRSPPKTYYLFVFVNNSFLLWFMIHQTTTRGPNAADDDLHVVPFTRAVPGVRDYMVPQH
jgi:hypothetical protein